MLEILLPCKPFSINHYHLATRRFKTADARAWEQVILEYLEDYRKPLSEIAEDFMMNGGCFRVSITCTYPHHIFYNKEGSISSKTMDCSNVEKPIIDLLFGMMGINDKYVVELLSKKEAGAGHAIKIQLQWRALSAD